MFEVLLPFEGLLLFVPFLPFLLIWICEPLEHSSSGEPLRRRVPLLRTEVPLLRTGVNLLRTRVILLRTGMTLIRTQVILLRMQVTLTLTRAKKKQVLTMMMMIGLLLPVDNTTNASH